MAVAPAGGGPIHASSRGLVDRSLRPLAAGGGARLDALTDRGKTLARAHGKKLGQRSGRMVSWAAQADAAGMEAEFRGQAYWGKFAQTAQLVVLCSRVLWASLAQNIKARVAAGEIEAVSLPGGTKAVLSKVSREWPLVDFKSLVYPREDSPRALADGGGVHATNRIIIFALNGARPRSQTPTEGSNNRKS